MNRALSCKPEAARNSGQLESPIGTGAGFYERIILRTLEGMGQGCLRLELPDGSHRVMGLPDSEFHANIRIRNKRFFQRCVLYGDIGFGESYVDGDWESGDIERVIAWFILNKEQSPSLLSERAKKTAINLLKGWNRIGHLLRPNSIATSRRNIAEHYDLGNDFYALWLDPTMTYSSALFTRPGQSLESAQLAKYEALAGKLQLKPSDHLLEIGTGWGGFSRHVARNSGCRVTTVTISQAQYEYASNLIQREGLSRQVEVVLQDYREIKGRFDKIISIEMMEALGDRYLETYFKKINGLLKAGGIAAFQYITVPDVFHPELKRGVDWIQKHIFPGSLLLSVGRVNQAINRTSNLSLHSLDDMGLSYAHTLRLWRQAFNARLDEVRALGFDARFIRKWNYYLSYCEAAFTMRNISVVQAVYTRPNNLHIGRKIES